MEIYDISIPITSSMIVWPGDPQVTIRQLSAIQQGEESNVTQIRMSVHTGSHIDAPKHFIDSGNTIEEIPLQKLIGDALVIEIDEKIDVISAEVLKSLLNFDGIKDIRKILFHTRNSAFWHQTSRTFQEDFVGIDSSGAEFLANFDLDLVGLDYLSIAPFHDISKPHKTLLSKEVILLEGIDLTAVPGGIYHLCCLPLKLIGIEGAPVRAILTR
jgi:arylformamidase